MQNLKVIASTLAAILLLWSASADAARVALLIGNAKYGSQPALRNPVNDAELLAKVLKRDLGFRDEEVRVVKDLRKRDLEIAVRRFVRESAGAEVAFLYFSGHGMQPSSGGRSFLLGVDAVVESDEALEADGVSVEALVEELERTPRPATLRVVVLDACRNSPFRRNAKGDVKGLAPVRPSDQFTLVGYATRAGDVAQDGLGANSPYATSLAKWLGRARDMPLRRIFEKAADDVKRATGQAQRPGTYGDLPSDISLFGTVIDTEGATKDAKDQSDGETAYWNEVKHIGTSGAYRSYKKRHPQGRYVDLADAALESLERDSYQRAMNASGSAGLNEFVKEFPESPRRADAEAELIRRREIANKPATAARSEKPALNDLQSFRDCSDCPEMVVIPEGVFEMGSPPGEGEADERPQRSVQVKRFAIGRHELTRGEFRTYLRDSGRSLSGCRSYEGTRWREVAAKNWEAPGYLQGEDHPLVCVSWEDAKGYLQWLSRKSGKEYRLPSEAEWEYASRARSKGSRYWGDGEGEACKHANVADRSGKRRYPGEYESFDCDDGYAETAPVGRFQENAFGLRDMLGNVLEWVGDCWNGSYGGAPKDSTAWLAGECSRRVVRGGSWFFEPSNVRTTARMRLVASSRYDLVGFRTARTLP